MKYYLLLIILFTVVSCSLKDDAVNPSGGSRNYYLGFTPYPYDVTSQAQDEVYDKISKDADIINHHFDDGVPWNEALLGKPLNANITADWENRKAKTPANHKVVVSVTPLNGQRDGLALYKAEQGNMSLPTDWAGYNLNNPSVREAYFSYCKQIIDFFEPDYFVFGIEVNLLINADPSLNKWNAYVNLHQYIYSKLKEAYPKLPLMVSFSGMDLIKDYTDANNTQQLIGFSDIMTSTDYFAISLYPFLSKFTAESLPDNLFNTLFAMSNKPICITETGYPAEAFSIYGGSVVYNGTKEKQNNYFQKLFSAADKFNVKFIINFVLRDYDKVWEAIGKPDDLSKVWRDTGLYDQDGNVRPAYETWKNKVNISIN